MINPGAPTTELLGFLRADLTFLAECLEGRHGDGRIVEAAPQCAQFIRTALAKPMLFLSTNQQAPMPRLLTGEVGGSIGPTSSGVDLALTDSERRMIEKQRAHAERNRGDADDGDEGLPS